MAATIAPATPIAMSHSEAWVRKPGWLTTCEAMSKTRLATQAPIGTVTRMGG